MTGQNQNIAYLYIFHLPSWLNIEITAVITPCSFPVPSHTPIMISVGLTANSNGVICEKATCDNQLTWSDGTAFTWQTWMESEIGTVTKYLNYVSCFNYLSYAEKIDNQNCVGGGGTYTYCEKSCVP